MSATGIGSEDEEVGHSLLLPILGDPALQRAARPRQVTQRRDRGELAGFAILLQALQTVFFPLFRSICHSDSFRDREGMLPRCQREEQLLILEATGATRLAE